MISWAKLLRRVFEIDIERCPNRDGALKIIAAILQAPVIEKILTGGSLWVAGAANQVSRSA